MAKHGGRTWTPEDEQALFEDPRNARVIAKEKGWHWDSTRLRRNKLMHEYATFRAGYASLFMTFTEQDLDSLTKIKYYEWKGWKPLERESTNDES